MAFDKRVNGQVVEMSNHTFVLNAWEPDQDPVIGPAISADTETELFKGQEFPDVVMLQVTAGKRVDLVHWEDIPVYMEKLLRYNTTSVFYFANAAYDLGVLDMDELYQLVDQRRLVDIFDRYKLWEISERGYVRKPASLANITKNVLRYTLNKDDNLRLNFTRAKEPTVPQLVYGSEDVMATWLNAERMPSMPTEDDSQIMGSLVLDGIKRNGMLVDREVFSSLHKKFSAEMAVNLADLEMRGYNPLLSKSSMDVLRCGLRDLGIDGTDLSTFSGPKLEYLLLRAIMATHQPLDRFKADVLNAIACAESECTPHFSMAEMIRSVVIDMEPEMEGKLKRDRLEAAYTKAKELPYKTLIDASRPKRINPFKGKMRKVLNESVRGLLSSTWDVPNGLGEYNTFSGLGLDEMALGVRLKNWALAFVFREILMAKAGKNLLLGKEFSQIEFRAYLETKSIMYGGFGPALDDCLRPAAFMQEHLRSLEMKNGIEFGRTDGGKEGKPEKKKIKVSSKDKWIFTMAGLEDKLVETYIEYSHNRKLISTYLNPAHIWPDGRVHSRYENYVRTGRTSSAKPNVQNIPGSGGMRQAYIPKKGHLYASIDYSQLELCSLAQHCYRVYGHSRMLELINANIDLHSWFAGKTMGLITADNDYDGTEESRLSVIALCDDITTNHNKQRKNAKAANFGFPGGMSAETFLRTQRGYGNIEITIEECRELRDNWFKAFPEMDKHMSPESDVVDDYDRKRFDDPYLRLSKATNIMGVLRRKCTFNSACNFPFQSLAALGAKRAMWVVWRDPRYKNLLVNFIHDELLLELPAATAAEDVAIIQKMMEDAMKEVLPDVRIEAEGCLMERWDKDAKPVFDVFGNLTVWHPEEEAA